MAKTHFPDKCRRIPLHIKARLVDLQRANKKAGGGKEYWIHCLKSCGVYDDGNVLRFNNENDSQDETVSNTARPSKDVDVVDAHPPSASSISLANRQKKKAKEPPSSNPGKPQTD